MRELRAEFRRVSAGREAVGAEVGHQDILFLPNYDGIIRGTVNIGAVTTNFGS
jgi:hypothetical protein